MELRHFLRIRTKPEIVFNAINSTKGLQGWWVITASGTFEQDSTITLGFGEHGSEDVRITALEQNKRIEWTGTNESDMWANTTITFSLTAENDNTTIVQFSHTDWDETVDKELIDNTNYNWGRFLFSLKTYCETGEGFPVGGWI